jgi:hypothetical protein
VKRKLEKLRELNKKRKRNSKENNKRLLNNKEKLKDKLKFNLENRINKLLGKLNKLMNLMQQKKK